jgi:hypothetical protein
VEFAYHPESREEPNVFRVPAFPSFRSPVIIQLIDANGIQVESGPTTLDPLPE